MFACAFRFSRNARLQSLHVQCVKMSNAEMDFEASILADVLTIIRYKKKGQKTQAFMDVQRDDGADKLDGDRQCLQEVGQHDT